MIIKVCGIKTEDNIRHLSESRIDMVGLNFYAPSVRYIKEDSDPSLFDSFNPTVKRVGVFVNETREFIQEKVNSYGLDYAQLHGDEDADFCKSISQILPIIKVFRIDEDFVFSSTERYSMASFFLFDTRTKHYGGSGLKFNWKQLEEYKGKIPFLLSGGIGPQDYKELQMLDHPKFAGIDINSKFEKAPGIKDVEVINDFISRLSL